MRKIGLTLAAVVAGSLLMAGCMTKKVATVDATGAAVTTTVVDTNNLAIDSSVLQGVTAIAVSMVAEKDPSTVPALKTAQKALDGVLNGATQATTQDVINMLKLQNNPTLTSEVTNLVTLVSALEQKLLAKYGAQVAGQIALELTRAVDAGMITGLAGK